MTIKCFGLYYIYYERNTLTLVVFYFLSILLHFIRKIFSKLSNDSGHCEAQIFSVMQYQILFKMKILAVDNSDFILFF